ncbi:MAG: hypothetical protein ACK5Q5_21280 [Planctomycetaceae bacterium]
MGRLSELLIPRIAIAEFPSLLAASTAGALIAGLYGVLHDQATYSIGPEYFTRFKFLQFAYADLGLGNRVFVGCIGFLATWWVGLIVGWILGRRCLPGRPRSQAWRLIGRGLMIVFCCGLLGGWCGYLYGLWRESTGDYSGWEATLAFHHVSNPWPFLRVGFIHNAGYLGGLLGLILTYLVIRPTAATMPSR